MFLVTDHEPLIKSWSKHRFRENGANQDMLPGIRVGLAQRSTEVALTWAPSRVDEAPRCGGD
eukprot:4861928-Pyramimonas_sp.AAC.1